MEQEMLFPFPTLSMGEKKYKLFGIVTNREIEGEELIHWHRKRCGKSEEAHGVMKHALAGGKLPRIINHSRQMIIQLQKKHPNFMLIKEARARILEMGYVPAG
jgi:hypothetical protein